jgi:pSer/pThr/pTyr-binding forkhead associated (FHA) protein
MIECPNCKHQEIPGALFCSECGAQLVGINTLFTQTIHADSTDKLAKFLSEQEKVPVPPPPSDVAISLFILETGAILPIGGRNEFTLGRSAEGQPILPDVDLARFQAYEHGVSRIHASITLGKEQALVTDLGSANGTRLNGQKLPPHRPFPTKHGDIVTLGKLRIQLLIRK